ncbi:MAG: hypothetical protein WD002_02955 [Pseudomonadales bacterium]
MADKLMDPEYAESMAVSGLQEDTTFSFIVRLARFPLKRKATLWVSAYIDGIDYAVTDEALSLSHDQATPIAKQEVEFEASGGSRAAFRSFDRHSAKMHGVVFAGSKAHKGEHPEPGSGSLPIVIETAFKVSHTPANVRPGRMEMMGRVAGTIMLGGDSWQFDMPGKWHEQVGPRPNFAPAFTYLFVQGEGIGIMTSKHARSAFGYLLANGETIAINDMQIEPYGNNPRAFTVTLEYGHQINGNARIIRETSVPIEGKRRPGATVIVDSDIGRMVGVLNDWNPDA